MNTSGKHPLSGLNDLDSAFASGWEFYKRWFLPLYAISVIMALISAVVSSRIDLSALQNPEDLAAITASLRGMMGTYTVLLLVSLFFNTMLHYFVIRRPLAEDFNFLEAMGTVLTKYYLPLLLVFILFGIFATFALMIGALLLFVGLFFAVPYVMIFLVLITPVMIIEDITIGDTISRVFTLAHRKFWPSMGLVSVFLLLLVFFSLIVSTLVMLPFSGSMMKSIFNPEDAAKVLEISKNPAFILLSSLTSGLTTPLLPILGVILYYRNSDDNPDGSGITGNSENGGGTRTEELYPSRDDQKSSKDEFRPTVDDLRP